MKINANINLIGDLNVEDSANDASFTLKDNVNGGTLNIESTANDANNVQAGTINFDPGESTGTQAAASITAQSSGTTATNRGGKITIKTKSDNGNLLNRLFIDKDSLETENLLTANINATTANINATTVNLQAGGSTKLSTNTNYITATVPVSLPDGSASAPVLTNAGDENTGIYFSTADTINIATNGIERLNINNSTITAGRNIDMQNTYQVLNLAAPISANQAATKAYVDAITTKIDTFTSSGTWTKPSGATRVLVYIANGGSGGNGGYKRNLKSLSEATCVYNNNFACSTYTGLLLPSALGGSGAAISIFEFDASMLPETVSVSVGAGGTGGAGSNSPTVGNAGSAGGVSSFGSLLTNSSASVGLWKSSFTSGSGAAAGKFSYNTTNSGPSTGQSLSSSPAVSGSTNSPSYVAMGLSTAVVISGGISSINSTATSSSEPVSILTRNTASGGGGGGSILITSSFTSARTSGSGGSGQIPGGGGGGGGSFFNFSSTGGTNTCGVTWTDHPEDGWYCSCSGTCNGSSPPTNYSTQISGAGGNGARGEVVVISYF